MKKILFILLVFICNSCGFYSFTGASIQNDVKTFSVDYFINKSNNINASLSSVFTETLKEHITSQTSLDEIENNGDVTFEGEIISYSIKPISIQSNEIARQNRLTIKVKVEFKNQSEINSNFTSNFSRYKDFPASENLSQVEETYMQEICIELAEDIFNKSFVNW
mgnify:CR=1 FL=1|tara:strand:+ start:31 stop:525 length:495 start_codon:yes stop_codon:yes gene_type:complete